MNESILFPIRLTFQVAIVSTFLTAIFGIIIAYILATRNFKGKILLEIIITLPLILPPTVTGYYLILIFGRNGIIGNLIFKLTEWNIMFTWWACVLASFIVSLPLMVKTAEAAIKSLDKTMIDTSYTLGYSEIQTAIKIVLPLAKNGIIAGIVLSFARSMGEFGATLMLAGNIPGRTNTMPLAIYSLVSSGEWDKTHLLVLILTISSTLFLLLTYKLGKSKNC
ncbi:MAG: molybdate ABC transporter permease subunit [Oligoflexia bacterium]|nr:molybdate ABC transporter permease subunit [Oligoflexia bacterium]